MLRGTKVGLRARRPEDVAPLHAELYDDASTRVRTDGSPWRPTAVDHSTFAVTEPVNRIAIFSCGSCATTGSRSATCTACRSRSSPTNAAMIGAAAAAGFVHEGTVREYAWVENRFHDEVIYGLLRDEWAANVSEVTVN